MKIVVRCFSVPTTSECKKFKWIQLPQVLFELIHHLWVVPILNLHSKILTTFPKFCCKRQKQLIRSSLRATNYIYLTCGYLSREFDVNGRCPHTVLRYNLQCISKLCDVTQSISVTWNLITFRMKNRIEFRASHYLFTLPNFFSLLARLESAYSLIWGSHEIWGKGGGDTLALLL